MTGAMWRSLCVAALFGLHPLRVESVAWVSERKDVLSTFFWLLTLWAYARFAGARSRKFYYALAVVFFALRPNVQADARDAALCSSAAGFSGR